MEGSGDRGVGRRGRQALAVLLALAFLVALFVAALPWLARPLIAGALGAALGRPVAIGALRWDAAGPSVVAEDIRIGRPPDQLSVQRVTITADLGVLDRHHLTIDRVDVEAPGGVLALDGFLPAASGGDEPRTEPPPLPVAVTVREIVVSDGALTLHPGPAIGSDVALVIHRARARNVELGSRALRLRGTVDGALDDAPLTGKVFVRLEGAERRVVGSLSVAKLALREGMASLPPPLASLTGTLDATAKLAIGAPAGRAEMQLELRLAKLQAAGPPGSSLRAASLVLPSGRVDLARRRIDLGPVTVRDPVLALDLAGLEQAPPTPESGAPTWSLRSGAVAVRGGELRLRRGDAATKVRIERVRWAGLRDRATALALAATAAGGGTLGVEGSVRVDPLVAELDLRAEALALAPWVRFVALPLQLERGTVSGSAKLVYRDGLRGVSGELRASDVHTLPPDPARPTEVLAAATAAAAFSYTPGAAGTIDVSSATLSYPYAMVVRSAAGTFPYSLLGGGSGEGGGSEEGGGPSLSVKQLNVVSGKVEFVDDTLQPPFWTSVTGLAGNAEQIALPPGTVGHFTLAGKRDELSPMSLSGAVTAQGLDARVEVSDVLLDSLNPYVAPLLGYRITAGRLSTVATAKPKPPMLVSVADVVLTGVDVSQIGTDVILEQSGVPLPIALSLIADASGQIDLNLPFTINTTSGHVAIGSVVWQAVRKAIVAALTSPLRLLGSLFGTQGAPHAFAVDPIPFATGSADLDDAGHARVGAIARIVQAHPTLLLVLLPQITDADRAAVGAGGAGALAKARNQAAREAFIDGKSGPALPAKRLLLAPWEPAKDATATQRPSVYVELQDAG